VPRTPLLGQIGQRPLFEPSWVPDNLDRIWAATTEHLYLTGVSVGIGLVVSLLLAVVALRWRGSYGPIVALGALLYTIPSLAMFAFLRPFTGFGAATAILTLMTYTVLVLVRNIVTAIDGVPADVLQAAEGMGYRPVAPVPGDRAAAGPAGDRRRDPGRDRDRDRAGHRRRAARPRRARPADPHRLPAARHLPDDDRGRGGRLGAAGDRLRPAAAGRRAGPDPVVASTGGRLMELLIDTVAWFTEPGRWTYAETGSVPFRRAAHLGDPGDDGAGDRDRRAAGAVPRPPPPGRGAASAVVNLGRAIPSFGLIVLFWLLALRIDWVGGEFWPLIGALVALALPPIFTNTYTAVREVDAATVEAARGMGYRSGAS
jgi:ABC-type proline/glycine betaine transport system permease subunit